MTNSNASPVKKGIRLRKRVGRFLGLYFFLNLLHLVIAFVTVETPE